jgi:hypothetical protein
MRRGRKSSWEGEQWIVALEKRESKGGKNRDKKIMMAKLILKKERNRSRNNKNSIFW